MMPKAGAVSITSLRSSPPPPGDQRMKRSGQVGDSFCIVKLPYPSRESPRDARARLLGEHAVFNSAIRACPPLSGRSGPRSKRGISMLSPGDLRLPAPRSAASVWPGRSWRWRWLGPRRCARATTQHDVGQRLALFGFAAEGLQQCVPGAPHRPASGSGQPASPAARTALSAGGHRGPSIPIGGKSTPSAAPKLAPIQRHPGNQGLGRDLRGDPLRLQCSIATIRVQQVAVVYFIGGGRQEEQRRLGKYEH